MAQSDILHQCNSSALPESVPVDPYLVLQTVFREAQTLVDRPGKFIVTIHSWGGSMGEAAEPRRVFGIFTSHRAASQFAHTFSVALRKIDESSATEVLPVVVELPDTSGVLDVQLCAQQYAQEMWGI